MKTVKNIKNIALIFFIITGVLHLGASILISNGIFLKEASITHTVMDIPFIITGLIYGLSSIRLGFSVEGQNYKVLDLSMIVFTSIILIALLALNIFIPDLPQS